MPHSSLVIFRVFKSGIHKGELLHTHIDSGATYHRICTGADMVYAWNLPEFEARVLPITRQATAAEYKPVLTNLAAASGQPLRRIAKLPGR